MSDSSSVDRMHERLQAWGCWLAGGSRGDGYATKNVLHESWLPPQPGMTPTMKVGLGSDRREREMHRAVQRLSVRLQNTLVVVYVQKLKASEQAERLDCNESTVRVRVMNARRQLVVLLSDRGFTS